MVLDKHSEDHKNEDNSSWEDTIIIVNGKPCMTYCIYCSDISIKANLMVMREEKSGDYQSL